MNVNLFTVEFHGLLECDSNEPDRFEIRPKLGVGDLELLGVGELELVLFSSTERISKCKDLEQLSFS